MHNTRQAMIAHIIDVWYCATLFIRQAADTDNPYRPFIEVGGTTDDSLSDIKFYIDKGKALMRSKAVRAFAVVPLPYITGQYRGHLRLIRESNFFDYMQDYPVIYTRDKDKDIPRIDSNSFVIRHTDDSGERDCIGVPIRENVYKRLTFSSRAAARDYIAKNAIAMVTSGQISRGSTLFIERDIGYRC